LENNMTVQIHEATVDPTAAGSVHVSLCGHDDDYDDGIPTNMVRRMFVGFVDGHTSTNVVADIKAFALQVATWLGVNDVYLYVPPIRVEENSMNMESRPLVWAFTPPIS